jgi:hypothetical protein
MGPGAETFHRPPREWPEPAPSEELRIQAPPTKPEPPSGGMVHAMFPAIGSFGLLAFALVYRNPLFMYIAIGLVCLSILLGFLIRWSQVRSVKKRRKRNRRKLDLEDEASTVRRGWEGVNYVPVTVDLRDARVVSVVGAPEAARALSRSLVCQLAVFRAPDDLRVLAYYEPPAAEEWECMGGRR